MLFLLKTFWCFLFYWQLFGAFYFTNNILVNVIFTKYILVHCYFTNDILLSKFAPPAPISSQLNQQPYWEFIKNIFKVAPLKNSFSKLLPHKVNYHNCSLNETLSKRHFQHCCLKSCFFKITFLKNIAVTSKCWSIFN